MDIHFVGPLNYWWGGQMCFEYYLINLVLSNNCNRLIANIY